VHQKQSYRYVSRVFSDAIFTLIIDQNFRKEYADEAKRVFNGHTEQMQQLTNQVQQLTTG
jgi:hypothetical protein